MAQPRPTRLRESAHAPQSAAVIDVPFKVVKGRRSRWVVFGRWVLAFAAAAAIGLLIPPVWIAIESMRG